MADEDLRPALARLSAALGRYDANVLLTALTCGLAVLLLVGVLAFGLF